jgi:hypothetical protein
VGRSLGVIEGVIMLSILHLDADDRIIRESESKTLNKGRNLRRSPEHTPYRELIYRYPLSINDQIRRIESRWQCHV